MTQKLNRIRLIRWGCIVLGLACFAMLMAVIPQIEGMWFRAAIAAAAGVFFGVAMNAVNQLRRGP